MPRRIMKYTKYISYSSNSPFYANQIIKLFLNSRISAYKEIMWTDLQTMVKFLQRGLFLYCKISFIKTHCTAYFGIMTCSIAFTLLLVVLITTSRVTKEVWRLASSTSISIAFWQLAFSLFSCCPPLASPASSLLSAPS